MTSARKTIWIDAEGTLARELEAGLGDHAVRVLPPGAAALGLLATEPAPALFVVDTPAACAAIRAHDPALPVLVVTDAVGGALDAGASDVVRLPLDARELVRRADQLLARVETDDATARFRLESLMRQVPVAICMFERPGLTFTFANAACEALVGGRPLIGRSFLEALPELGGRGLDVILERVFATGEPYEGTEVTFELAHHAPGESAVLNLRYSARRTRRGEIDGVIATITDVTAHVVARRRAESLAEELRESRHALADERETLAGIFEVSPAAMALWRGTDLTFELVNPVYQAIFPGRQLLGVPLLTAVPELAGQPFPALLQQVLATGTPHVGREVLTQLVGPDGTLEDHYYDFTYARIHDAQGRPLGVYDHAIDVTDRVRAHRQVQESQAREQKLREQAENANRSKDEFLAILGHEMRNPLAPISTALELMKLRPEAGAFAKERTIIQRQVDHLTRLVDDLLDVSRITQGKVEIHRKHVDLASLVASAVELVSPLLEQRHHQLAIAVPAQGLWLYADPVRMVQVISNLVANAAKYTEANGQLHVEAGRDGDEVWLAVRDNGIGIAADMLPHVFELFAQEPQSLDRARGGLGLGLTIVRSLVTMHGGTITAESAGRGRGSCFTLRLPAAPTPSTHVRPAPAISATGATVATKRVLVVDDNADAAELLALTLEMRGHTVQVAHDGPEALRAVESFVPDLAILDIGLPVMTGYELARRLRELPALQGMRMVALTGYGQASDRKRSAEAGFDAHLVKPLRIEELEALVERA